LKKPMQPLIILYKYIINLPIQTKKKNYLVLIYFGWKKHIKITSFF
jgi:hypothetical protein